MTIEDDAAVIRRVREKASELASAMSAAAETGLLLKCAAGFAVSHFEHDKLTKQQDWYVSIEASRIYRF